MSKTIEFKSVFFFCRAVAEYLSKDLPNKLSADDVFLRMGCKQAYETILQVLGGSKSNILLPKPGFPYYDVLAKLYHLEPRFYDLLPEKNWEIDLDSVVAVADENTVAMVIVNPGNPCGNVFTYQHLKKVPMCIFYFIPHHDKIRLVTLS